MSSRQCPLQSSNGRPLEVYRIERHVFKANVVPVQKIPGFRILCSRNSGYREIVNGVTSPVPRGMSGQSIAAVADQGQQRSVDVDEDFVDELLNDAPAVNDNADIGNNANVIDGNINAIDEGIAMDLDVGDVNRASGLLAELSQPREEEAEHAPAVPDATPSVRARLLINSVPLSAAPDVDVDDAVPISPAVLADSILEAIRQRNSTAVSSAAAEEGVEEPLSDNDNDGNVDHMDETDDLNAEVSQDLD